MYQLITYGKEGVRKVKKYIKPLLLTTTYSIVILFTSKPSLAEKQKLNSTSPQIIQQNSQRKDGEESSLFKKTQVNFLKQKLAYLRKTEQFLSNHVVSVHEEIELTKSRLIDLDPEWKDCPPLSAELLRALSIRGGKMKE